MKAAPWSNDQESLERHASSAGMEVAPSRSNDLVAIPRESDGIEAYDSGTPTRGYAHQSPHSPGPMYAPNGREYQKSPLSPQAYPFAHATPPPGYLPAHHDAGDGKGTKRRVLGLTPVTLWLIVALFLAVTTGSAA